MADLVSIREFARRDGCSHTLVQNAIREGYLTLQSGRLDAALVKSPWRPSNRHGGRGTTGNDAVASFGETPTAAAERIVGGAVALLSIADAEQVKENYLARLRQLEYDQKAGAVVPVAEVAKVLGARCAAVRTMLLSIPAEAAPEIHRCKTVAETQAVLMRRVVAALEHLSGGDDAERN